MKRDWDLVRAILFEVEKIPEDARAISDKVIAKALDGKWSTILVQEHIKRMEERGLLDADCDDTLGPKSNLECFVSGITWEGYELIDAIRADTIWNKTKEKAGAMTLEVIKSIAEGFAKGGF